MKPIGKNIIIKTIDEEIKTSSGLLLSSEDANQLRYKKGVIIKFFGYMLRVLEK